MYSHAYSRKVQNIEKKKLWSIWTDINKWHTWQDDLDFAKAETDFKSGSWFTLKPKGGPKVKIELVEVIPGSSFTDLTRFPFAKMYGKHDFIEHTDGLEIKTTMSIEGPLSFLWKKLVYDGIVKKLEAQTEALVEKAINEK